MAPTRRAREKNSRRRRDALIDSRQANSGYICLELERVRPVIVRGSTAPRAQFHQ